MTEPTLMRRYWRVGFVALLGAVLAFASSYLVSPTYASSTRLIIHGQDPNFLSNTGEATVGGSITDSGTAKALADTYGSIATSRSVAIAVVDQLRLDKEKDGTGFVHDIAGGLATAYRCTRAFISSGFCASPNKRETAIELVQTGTVAQQLGANAGDSAGQPGSYVLEVTSSADDPGKARDIANAVADQLVLASARQARQSANTHVLLLDKQIAQAKTDIAQQIAGITTYQLAHFPSSGTGKSQAASGSYEALSVSLNSVQADLADAQAQQSSILASLSVTQPANDANPAYVQLTSQQTSVAAQISGLKARQSLLEKQISLVAPAKANVALAQLSILQTQLDTTRGTLTSLVAQVQAAKAAAGTVQSDLTRIDTAGTPTYPIAPLRYLYLLIGLLLGGLAGGGLTWLRERRSPSPAGSDPDDANTVDVPAARVNVLDTTPLAGFNGSSVNGGVMVLDTAPVAAEETTAQFPAITGGLSDVGLSDVDEPVRTHDVDVSVGTHDVDAPAEPTDTSRTRRRTRRHSAHGA